MTDLTPEMITPLKAVRLLMGGETVVVRNETWVTLMEQLAAERARAEAAEGREARLRPVWDAVERMQVVRASMYGLVDTVLDDDSAVEAVGNAMESANRALFSAALDVLDVYRAALAGEGQG